MSLWSKIFAPMVGQTVKDVASGVGGLAKDIRSAITGEMSPESKAKLEELAQRGDQIAQQGQVEINKLEAGHKSIFVAGWRPFIGWVCGFAIAWNYLIHPLLSWVLVFTDIQATPPKLSMTELFPVIIGMLGLGVYRTYEKAKKVEGNR